MKAGNSMYGLRRIIQIDGFIPGVRTVIEVDGHSIINGTNGAGKSSTLKLLSFFYGGDSTQLDGLEPFLNFYLPRQTSLLIFEYARESGLCCVAIYRHKSGTKHAYRFLQGEFTEDRFSQTDNAGATVYCKGHDLKMHWRGMDLTCSQQIEVVTDYRAIIQNDAVLINRLSDSKALRRLAADYCLGSRKTHMRHIDRICSSIIRRHGNMERMKDMLADIMSEDGVVFPESPLHRSDIALAEEINSLREFDRHLPQIKALISTHGEWGVLITEINSYISRVLKEETSLIQDIDSKTQDVASAQSKIDNYKIEWESRYQSLRQNQVDTAATLKNREASVEALDAKYAEYEHLGMELKSAEFENLPLFIERNKEASLRYTTLTENVAAEEQTLNRDLKDEMARYEGKRRAAQEKLDAARRDIQAAEREYNEQRERILQEEHAAAHKARQEAEPERNKLILDRANAKARSKNEGRSDEEGRTLKEAEAHIDATERSLSGLRGAASQKENELNSCKLERDNATQKHGHARKRQTELQEELEKLHKLAYAEDGTWLKKLREVDPDWVSRIGKVIDPQLLQRKNLSASFDSDDHGLIFGWSLNLDSISPPQYASSEEDLRHEYATQEDRVRLAQEDVTQTEAQCERINKKYVAAEEACESARRALRQAEIKRDEAIRHYREQTQIIDQAVAGRRLSAKKEADLLDAACSAFDKALDERVQVISTNFKTARSDAHGAWGLLSSNLNDGIERQVAHGAEIKKHHDLRIKQIQDDFNKACSEKGIDESTLELARKDLSDTRAKVAEVEGFASEVKIYRLWITHEWKSRKALLIELDDLRNNHNEIITTIEREQLTYATHFKEFIAHKKQLEQELTGLNGKKTRIDMLKPRLGPLPTSTETATDNTPFDLILEKIDSALSQREKLRETLLKEAQSVNSMIERFSGTQIGKAWNAAKDSLKQAQGVNDFYEPKFLLNLPPVLKTFIDKEIRTIKGARIESLRGVGKGLADFYDKLTVIHNDINTQSARITGVIKKYMMIDALSEIQLQLSSRVENTDYWKKAKSFSHSWKRWRDTDGESLPDNQFIDEMDSLISALGAVKSGHHLRDYFDLHIRMVENGHVRVIHNDHQFEHATSEGLRYLAVCIIFIGISRLLCPDTQVSLHWPVDEIGILASENVTKLFTILNQGRIVMVGGFPNTDPGILRHFKNRQIISLTDGVRIIDIPKATLKDMALERIAHRSMQ